jgi:hypothetical protein
MTSDDLIAKLEAATEGSRDLDYAIAEYLGREAVREKQGTFAPWKYTTCIDAALTLVPERGDLGLTWRFILERKPLHSGPGWICEVREHAKEGGYAVAHTAPLAICIAALKAIEGGRDGTD